MLLVPLINMRLWDSQEEELSVLGDARFIYTQVGVFPCPWGFYMDTGAWTQKSQIQIEKGAKVPSLPLKKCIPFQKHFAPKTEEIFLGGFGSLSGQRTTRRLGKPHFICCPTTHREVAVIQGWHSWFTDQSSREENKGLVESIPALSAFATPLWTLAGVRFTLLFQVNLFAPFSLHYFFHIKENNLKTPSNFLWVSSKPHKLWLMKLCKIPICVFFRRGQCKKEFRAHRWYSVSLQLASLKFSTKIS